MIKNPSNKRKILITSNAKPSKIRKIKSKVFVKATNDDIQTEKNVKVQKQTNTKQNGKNYSKRKELEEVEEDIESLDESNEVESNNSSGEINNESSNDSESAVSSNNDDDSDSCNELDEENDIEENELNKLVVSNNGSNYEEEEDTDAEENDNSNDENDDSGDEGNENSIKVENETSDEEEDNSDEETNISDDNENDDSDDEENIVNDNENDHSNDEENDNDTDDEENDNDTDDEKNDNDTDDEENDNSIDEKTETIRKPPTSNSKDFDFSSKNSVFVQGIKGVTVNDIFSDCNIDTFNLLPNKHFKDVENAVIKFKDLKSFQRALQKNNYCFNGFAIKVKPHNNRNELEDKFKLCVSVTGLPRNVNIRDVFKDCQIKSFHWPTNSVTNEVLGVANVFFKDMESVKKALSKDRTKFNGFIMTVRYRCFDKCVHVRGLSKNLKVENIFNDCKIFHYESAYTNENRNKLVTIYFEDEESVERALSKNDTTFNGCTLDIKRRKCILLVTGLKYESTIDKLFNKEGIISYNLIRSYDGKFQGEAIVYFKNRETVQQALQKNSKTVDGNKVFITYFEPKNQNKFQNPSNRNYNKFNNNKNKFQNPSNRNYNKSNNNKNKFQKTTNKKYNKFNNKKKQKKIQNPTNRNNNKFHNYENPTHTECNALNKDEIIKKSGPKSKNHLNMLLLAELKKQARKISIELRKFKRKQ